MGSARNLNGTNIITHEVMGSARNLNGTNIITHWIMGSARNLNGTNIITHVPPLGPGPMGRTGPGPGANGPDPGVLPGEISSF